MRPRRHRYDLALITLLLRLVLHAGTALRAAARACVLSVSLAAGPDPATGRLWLLRLGLYRLTRPVQPAEDWCWLVDHSALLGRQRLLTVLGLGLRPWAKRAARGHGALRFADVRVLKVAAVTDPNAETMATQLDTLAQDAGNPRVIVSDHGADVWAGIRRFRVDRPEVAEVCDFKHFAANQLKGLLEGQSTWKEFQTQLGRTRAALQQTEWALVVPPALRTKSRYLNLDVLLNWAAKARALLDLPEEERALRGDVKRLERALGWLRELDSQRAEWQQWLSLTEEAVRSVREEGLHRQSAEGLAWQLAGLTTTESGRQLSGKLVAFVKEQQEQAQQGERLLASTEILESLFGRFKALSREHSRGGVTALALALPALLGAPAEEELAEALSHCPTKEVRQWVAKNLPPNLQQQRCWLRSLLPKRKKKRTEEVPKVA